MGSTFGGYNIAYSGMRVSQSALTVTSNNLSNVNTDGYSRQRIANEENVINLSGQTTVGTGVTVEEVRRARNQLLDNTYHKQNATASYWSTKSGMVDYMQQILDEFGASDGSGSDGLQQVIQDFFDGWEELSTDSGDQTNRQAILEYAATLIDTFQSMDDALAALQQDAYNSASDIVTEINDIASQIATLNLQVVKDEAVSGEASDLRDQRDALLDELSNYTNFSTQEQENGSVSVFIAGIALVSLDKTSKLSLEGEGTEASPASVQWVDMNEAAKITSGTLKACLEDADQDGVSTPITDFTASATSSVTNLRQSLNYTLTTLVTKVNSLLTSGIDLNGDAGTAMFVVVDSTKSLSLTNIKVNEELTNDLNKIATGTTGEASDNSIAAKICDLCDEDLLSYNGLSQDIFNFYQSTVSWVGTVGSDTSDYYSTYTTLATQADNQRQSISSTSLDEEMSNMIMFQNAYSASARVLSTMDGLIADMIEELG